MTAILAALRSPLAPLLAGISIVVAGGGLILLAWLNVYEPLGREAVQGVFWCGLLWLFVSDGQPRSDGARTGRKPAADPTNPAGGALDP
jgi:hypothetical protein